MLYQNKAQAVQDALRIYAYIVEHPYCSKHDAVKALGITGLGINNCPLCEVFYIDKCKACPISDKVLLASCALDTGPYGLFVQSKTDAARRQAAQNIVDICKAYLRSPACAQ